jgi:CubicO group peptidase (beta-lactamase class C family)
MTAPPLPRSAPEAQGIPCGAIVAFVDAVEAAGLELHGFVLLRRGAVVAEGYWEPYRADRPHMQFSLAKSFTSTAIGLLVGEGRLSIDDGVLALFPDLAPAEPSENLQAMRVRHLLTMTTGHAANPLRAMRLGGPDWTRRFLAQPVEHAPGTRFVYNDAASYALSAIVQRIAGQRLTEYLRPRLLDPLGIEQLTWRTSPEGVDLGGWEMSATTAEVARFGQLLLQAGRWRGEQLAPAAWVAEATARQVPSAGIPGGEWEQGYGYQFWRCTHSAYRADGAFGQLCVVMPQREAVLAVNAGVSLGAYGRLLELVWEHLLPAMESRPLPASPAAALALADRLAGLRLAPAAGECASRLAATLSGRRFAVAANPERIETIAFGFRDDGCTLTTRDDHGDQRIPCGHGRWERGEATAMQRTMFRAEPSEGDPPPAKVAASGAWADEHTYVVRLRWYETAFGRTLTCRFDGDRVTIEQAQNVSFGPTARACLQGSARH